MNKIHTFWVLSFLIAGSAVAQLNRVNEPIDDERRTRLKGHVKPGANAANDLGRVDPSEVLSDLTITLSPSEEQQAALDQLIADQQNPASPNYHRWLTPEDFADRFGAAPSDIEKIASWLEQRNLHVTDVGKSRRSISCSGAARDIETAFRTEFHRYQLDGRDHFANASDPSVPSALAGAVLSIRGLNDFRLKPRLKHRDEVGTAPLYTSGSGKHYLSPEDFAIIYNVKPLHDAGLNGSGQKIVIAGQTQIDLSDFRLFRDRFHLASSDPQVMLVPNTRDPGANKSEQEEANLDLEWASAIVPDATLLYVYSPDVMGSVQYAIDQNLAPVISVSYGGCETQTARSEALTMQSWAKQANAQGITWINASGDSGGADCVSKTSTRNGGLAVDIPASIPEVTGIGGTTFNEGSGQFWADGNATNSASVNAYVPEIVWNDSVAGDPASGGGGPSAFFSKPSWQTGPGVPADAARYVPDVSFASSAEHDGYMVYTGGKLAIFGGTSAATPAFAGITALLNQYLVATGAQSTPGVGNVNPRLYALAQTTPDAFHDVTTGNNIIAVTCGARTRNCVSGSYGFEAGVGYDQATGLGSVDAYKLVTSWKGSGNSIARIQVSLTLTPNSSNLTTADTLVLTAVASAKDGGTPTGTIIFSSKGVELGRVGLADSTAVLTVAASSLQQGANPIDAEYAGDRSYAAASAVTNVDVTAPAPQTPSISGVANGASYAPGYAPGMFAAIFGTGLAPASGAAKSVPLPKQLAGVSATVDGVSAPLYYVSASQLNVQIPYETATNHTAVLIVNNNGRTARTTLPIVSAAPGIFAGTTGSVARGQSAVIYVTGAGAQSPAIASGAAPGAGTTLTQLPRPTQATVLTIGDRAAAIDFIGTPPGLVGVTQINFRASTSTALGAQPLVVTLGNVVSRPITVTVQ